MYGYSITGNQPLQGSVAISGSKNATLPILAATLLTDEPCILHHVPDIRDIRTMIALLETLGKSIQFEQNTLVVETNPDPSINRIHAPYEIVKTMRASICVLGPILSRYNEAIVALPGGCALGPRPVDLHIKGMEHLGANIKVDAGNLICNAISLHGSEFELRGPFGPTVLGTDNVVMAATLAQGTTRLKSAAMEPEVVDVCNFLVKMGADIEGIGTDELTIHGVSKLNGAEHTVIPDRIETGTMIAMIGATKGEATITHANPDLLTRPIEVFRTMGIHIKQTDVSTLEVVYTHRFSPYSLITAPYPGFPTDLQPILTVLNALANGKSQVSESIYPDRFMYVSEINRMGSQITIDEEGASIQGVDQFKGAQLMASDLRAGAALVIAALAAEGESMISRIYHIERGYEKLPEKIKALGGMIEKIELEKEQW